VTGTFPLDLNLTLIQDHGAERPRLFVELTTEYTKGYRASTLPRSCTVSVFSNGLNEQTLPLKEGLDDCFIFCQAVWEAYGVRIAHEVQLS
jgi:hypothetical protein